MRFIENPQENRTTTCLTCGLHYSLVDPADFKRRHPRHHRKFVYSRASRGVQNGVDRAADKSRGWDMVLHGKTAAERVEGALLIVKAHYDRHLLGQKIETPFEEYIAALDAIGYDGFLTIEREVGENPAVDIVKAVEYLRTL